MPRPIRKPAPAPDVVDLRAHEGVPAPEVVRAVLACAADVVFSDGVSAEFLDQWTFETLQLLEAHAAHVADARPRRRVTASAGRPR